MSTKSLDLSLPLNSHRRNLSNDMSSSVQCNREHVKTKLDSNRAQCYEELGAKLIEDRLLLTALELYAELGEAGHEVTCLKQFFSNPGNFEKSANTDVSRMLVRSMSQTTLDSLDFAPISEDGDRAGIDRVAVLEFELRKAKETIIALRENLTQQVELENASVRSETESTGSQNAGAVAQHTTPEPMRAYEQRAINFLVHEYLLTHGYRLTSITFADENTEQDFEHWDDVGLNMERPADLLSIYRHRFRPVLPINTVRMDDVETQTEETNDSDSSDLTMQLCASTEESGNNSYDVSTSSVPTSKSEPQTISLTTHRDSIVSNIPVSISNSRSPSVRSIDSSIPIPLTNAHFELNSIQTAFPQSAQLQNSARALKEELQQGVEDVCQKLNNFFGKPNTTIPNNSKPIGFHHAKTPDRSSFSLFNNK